MPVADDDLLVWFHRFPRDHLVKHRTARSSPAA